MTMRTPVISGRKMTPADRAAVEKSFDTLRKLNAQPPSLERNARITRRMNSIRLHTGMSYDAIVLKAKAKPWVRTKPLVTHTDMVKTLQAHFH